MDAAEPNEIVMRPCRPSDLAAVLDLMAQLDEVSGGGTPLDLPILARLLAEMDANPHFYLNLVAEAGGRAVGFLSLIFYRTLYHSGGTALINELVVDRSLRGQGVGRMLVARAEQEARSRGMDELEVGTENENQAARAFYQRAGFDEEYVLLGMEFGDSKD